MTQYPLPTEINWSLGFTEGLKYLNTVTHSWFSNMLLIGIYAIFVAGFYFSKKDIFGGFAVGGFATFTIALLFWVSEIINSTTFLIVIAIAIMGFASLWIGGEK